MKEKNRNFLLIPLDITDAIHIYSGELRDLFAQVYNFSKDGAHVYRASIKDMMDFLHVSENTARKHINTLVDSGFVLRGDPTVVIRKGESKHAKYEYRANIKGILERLEAGEEVYPVYKKMGAKIAPILEDQMGANFEVERVQILSEMGAKIAPHNKESVRNTLSNYYSSASARQACSLQQEEKEEFYKIFFVLNAADPAAEVAQFVTMNEDQNWTTPKTGHVFETPVERRSLAYRWAHKVSKKRLPDGETTDNFYKFLEALYYLAKVRGGIISQHILDIKSYYVEDDTVITWYGSLEVREWVQSLWSDDIVPIKNKYLGEHIRLLYQAYDA